MTKFSYQEMMHEKGFLHPIGFIDDLDWEHVRENTIDAMRKHGYVWWKDGTHEQAIKLRDFLGQHVYTTDVKSKEDSKAMLSKKEAIGPHTDHHDVDFILWYVHQGCNDGGETMLYPFERILESMSNSQMARSMFHPKYRDLKCKEHKVFPDDPGEHLVIQRTGQRQSIFRNLASNILDAHKPLVYYSFWLADHQDNDDNKLWFKMFQKSIEDTKPLRGYLNQNDIFIFDNRLNLHARTEYFDDKRHLERHWIKAVI